MNVFQADLHIHSVLSPCSNLDMSPVNIIQAASKQKLDIIGITDHNSTRHGPIIKRIGEQCGIFVLQGVEVTTKEEIHCLAFFENEDFLNEFQQYLTEHLPFVQNDPNYFGYQVVVNDEEHIIEEIESLLIVGIDQSIDEVDRKIRTLNGIFIPAHIDRPHNGLLSQIGFMPKQMIPDAIEINGSSLKTDFLIKYPEFSRFSIIKNSDAHSLSQIGCRQTGFKLDKVSFGEIVLALHKEYGREVILS